MEISYKGHVKEIVAGAWWNGAPVAEIWLRGEKLYPIEGNAATELILDVTLGKVGGELPYWLHALDWHEKMPRPVIGYEKETILFAGIKRGIEIRTMEEEYKEKNYKVSDTLSFKTWNGLRLFRSYHVKVYGQAPIYGQRTLFDLVIDGKTYHEGTDFLFNHNTGFIGFLVKDQLPEISSLQAGAKVKLKASIPEREMEEETLENLQKNGSASRIYNLPLIKDTAFHLAWQKPGKKDTAHENFTIAGVPSGQVYMKGHGQKNGHAHPHNCSVTIKPVQGSRVVDGHVDVANNAWPTGDYQYKIDLESSYNAQLARCYPIYPAFTKEWSLNVVGVVIKQV